MVRAAVSGAGPRVGARVVGHPPAGGWAERVAVPVSQLALVPDEVPLVVAAALPLAGLTALRLIRRAGDLSSRRILITGASGGVGHYFCELAAAHGADITVVTGSAERGARLLELGAQRVVAAVSEAEGPFNVGLESVGGTNLAAMLARLTHDGRLIWFGQASRQPPTLDFLDFAGGLAATIAKFDYSVGDDAADLTTLVRLTASGVLHPEIGYRASWREAPAAIEALLGRQVRGNIVLTVD